MFTTMHNLKKCTKNILLEINKKKTIKSVMNNIKRSMCVNSTDNGTPAEKTDASNTTVNSEANKLELEIVDVNMNEMMENDYINNSVQSHTKAENKMSYNKGTTAPIDIDPWVDEEVHTGGTVEYEKVKEYKTEPLIYPPTNDPPKERQGLYEFDGIKIWLPPSMYNPGTYRYRVDPKDKDLIPDDTRILIFKKTIVNDKKKAK